MFEKLKNALGIPPLRTEFKGRVVYTGAGAISEGSVGWEIELRNETGERILVTGKTVAPADCKFPFNVSGTDEVAVHTKEVFRPGTINSLLPTKTFKAESENIVAANRLEF